MRRWALCPTAAALIAFGVFGCSTPLMRGPLGLRTFAPDDPERTAADPDEYELHAAAGCSSDEPRPLVVAFHGAFSSPEEMEEESGLSLLADREGFHVVYPHGSGFLEMLQHWNSGNCCGPAQEQGVDDIAFTREVIAAVDQRVAVDPSRVYLVGMSNGAMMTHRAAAELSDVIAAAAAVAGTVGGRPSAEEEVWIVPDPGQPVPMLLMHGRTDDTVPWDGGIDPFGSGGRTFVGVDETVGFWRRANGAREPAALDRLREDRITRSRWSGDAEVVLYAISDWEHAWPGGEYTRDLPPEDALSGFEAGEEIWPFLARHRRPGRGGPAHLVPCRGSRPRSTSVPSARASAKGEHGR